MGMKKKLRFFTLHFWLRRAKGPLFIFLVLLCGCSDDISSIYSFREQVFCQFNALQYAALNQVMDNYGEFATLRLKFDVAPKVEMNYRGTSFPYTDALIKNFLLGLGGLIVGTTHFGEYRCYDLACPICDRADRRLTLTNDGYAKCGKCGVSFDLNNDGVIHTVPEDAQLDTHRGLYRYFITYDNISHILTIKNAP